MQYFTNARFLKNLKYISVRAWRRAISPNTWSMSLAAILLAAEPAPPDPDAPEDMSAELFHKNEMLSSVILWTRKKFIKKITLSRLVKVKCATKESLLSFLILRRKQCIILTKRVNLLRSLCHLDKRDAREASRTRLILSERLRFRRNCFMIWKEMECKRTLISRKLGRVVYKNNRHLLSIAVCGKINWNDGSTWFYITSPT